MIGIRTPFRVSFTGGSTDLPSFYKKNGGKVISTSINKYMYHFIHKFDEELIQVKYSETELVRDPKKIKHKIVKKIAEQSDLFGLDINSIADIPKGSGLGSSSAYTVGLINGINVFHGNILSKENLANESADLEINKLNEPIGKQDHYASAYGGLNLITFNKDDSVDVENIYIDEQAINYLNSSLLLIKVGESRSASEILSEQNKSYENDTNNDLGKKIMELVDPMVDAIKSSNIKEIGEILNINWNLKNKLSNSVSNNEIENLVQDLISHKGIYGAKLLGAGGGGFILVCGEPNILNKIGFENKVSFKLENTGSTIIFQD
tara:strand:+ start:1361 stop:2323 length:963 start_codon:yes stop_codon:yes gene_type:complete